MRLKYLVLFSICNSSLPESDVNVTDHVNTSKNSNETTVKSQRNLRFEIDDEFCPEVYVENLPVLGTYVQKVDFNGQIVDYAKCIYVVIGKWVPYTDADTMCRKYFKGECAGCFGELASIHSQAQNDVVQNIMQSSQDPNAPYSPYWIGLRQHCRGCEYEWSNFSPVDYVNWGNGEPNDGGEGEDCGSLLAWDGKWNDDHCDKGFQFVCEVYSETKHPTVNGDAAWSTSGGCKQGWTKYAKACYLKVGGYTADSTGTDQLRKFNDASVYCQGTWSGGSLAIMPNRFYNLFVTAFTKSFGRDLWIGAQSTVQDKAFHWVDQSRMTYTNWQPGQPSGSDDPEAFHDEVAMSTWGHMEQDQYRPGQWYDDDGNDKKGFLCSHPLSSSEQSVSTSFCPDGWTQYGYACYQMRFQQPTSWDNGNSECAQYWTGDSSWKSTLATIVDEYENALVASLLYDEQTGYDINLNHFPGVHIGYMGVKEITGQSMEFKWVDTEFSATYTHWYFGEPDTVGLQPGNKACVYMTKDSLWRTDWGCETTLPYVCKAVPPNAYITQDDRGKFAPCNETHGWYSTQTHEEQGFYCIKAFQEKVSFYEGDDRCQHHHGGHLVSIHSASVNQRVLEVTGATLGSKNWFWIGLQRNTAGGLKWSDGSAANFFSWGTDWSPDDNLEDDCTDMGYQGLWGMEKCTKPAYFICEVPRAMENCVYVPKAERVACGYPGIIMDTCLKDFNCCWDGLAAPMSCYHPGGRKVDSSSGMSIAGAVILSMFIWGVLLGATVYYFVKMR